MSPLRPASGPNDYGSNALAAAMTFAVAVAVFALLGHWLDEKFATSPWLLVVGCLLGTAGGMLHLIGKVAPGALWKRPRDGGGKR